MRYNISDCNAKLTDGWQIIDLDFLPVRCWRDMLTSTSEERGEEKEGEAEENGRQNGNAKRERSPEGCRGMGMISREGRTN